MSAAKSKLQQTTVTPTPEPIVPRALDIRQASLYTSCAVWNLRTSVWAGKLRAHLAGKRLLFLREDLDEFLEMLPEVRSGRVVNAPRHPRKRAA
jgi:hypothetical protein